MPNEYDYIVVWGGIGRIGTGGAPFRRPSQVERERTIRRGNLCPM